MRREIVRKTLLAGVAALVLGACALGGNKAVAPPAVFDLGPLGNTTAAPLPDLLLTEISAPPWLAGAGIAYRLVYLNEFQAQHYRDSRWAAPPAALLTERLRQKLALGARGAGNGKPVLLRLELVEFEQRFGSPTQSEVRVSLRARLGEGASLVQAFELVKPSRSADAAGAVQAFSEASDEILAQVLAWAAANASKP